MAEKKTLPRVERVEGEERKKALSAALAQIEKQFGKGSIMRMGDKGMSEDIDVVSTGSLGLDLALESAVCPVAVLSKFMVRNLQVRPHWLCMWWLKCKKPVEPVLILTLNTL